VAEDGGDRGSAAGEQGELRLGLTISGAIALGAFEGGALAALLAGTQAVNEVRRDALRIDAIAGASAGSITGLLTARVLLAGLDPIETMYQSWVVTPQLEKITDALDSPLSVEGTRKDAETLLRGEEHPACAQSKPISLSMALGCLRGLEYKIGRISGKPITAGTYLDRAEFEFKSGEGPERFLGDPLDAALASGAHAAAFPPIVLDRSGARQDYVDHGIQNFPPSKHLWYTDGGTIDNEPLGSGLDLAQGRDDAEPLGDAARLHLLITPDPKLAGTEDDQWSKPSIRPLWTKTGLQTVKLARSQRLYDDLRRLEKTNSRIEWLGLVQRKLVEILGGSGEDPEAAMKGVAETIKHQKKRLDENDDLRSKRCDDEQPVEESSKLAKALREALDSATGLAGKRSIATAVVSPFTLGEGGGASNPSHDLLAGEFLGHFGGFLQQDLREHDFGLGYRCMLAWMEQGGLTDDCRLDENLARVAVQGAKRAREDWESGNHEWRHDLGDASLSKLPLRVRLRLYAVAARSALIVFKQLRPRRS
jgi:hypothetical protein